MEEGIAVNKHYIRPDEYGENYDPPRPFFPRFDTVALCEGDRQEDDTLRKDRGEHFYVPRKSPLRFAIFFALGMIFLAIILALIQPKPAHGATIDPTKPCPSSIVCVSWPAVTQMTDGSTIPSSAVITYVIFHSTSPTGTFTQLDTTTALAKIYTSLPFGPHCFRVATSIDGGASMGALSGVACKTTARIPGPTQGSIEAPSDGSIEAR
jgi:hypothetical protein